MTGRWWSPMSNEFTWRQVWWRWSTLTQRQHCGLPCQPQQQQQHLRPSSDNVSFSLNDVGVTRARSHLHVFCQARVGRGCPPQTGVAAGKRHPPARRAAGRPVASAHRPAGPLERCWESTGADADAFFVSADLTYVDGDRCCRCVLAERALTSVPSVYVGASSCSSSGNDNASTLSRATSCLTFSSTSLSVSHLLAAWLLRTPTGSESAGLSTTTLQPFRILVYAGHVPRTGGTAVTSQSTTIFWTEAANVVLSTPRTSSCTRADRCRWWTRPATEHSRRPEVNWLRVSTVANISSVCAISPVCNGFFNISNIHVAWNQLLFIYSFDLLMNMHLNVRIASSDAVIVSK